MKASLVAGGPESGLPVHGAGAKLPVKSWSAAMLAAALCSADVLGADGADELGADGAGADDPEAANGWGASEGAAWVSADEDGVAAVSVAAVVCFAGFALILPCSFAEFFFFFFSSSA